MKANRNSKDGIVPTIPTDKFISLFLTEEKGSERYFYITGGYLFKIQIAKFKIEAKLTQAR